MRFHHNYRYKRRGPGLPGILGIVGAGVLVVLAMMQPTFLTKAFLAVARPLHLVRQDATGSVADAFQKTQTKEELLVENERLAEELKKAEIKANLFDEMRGATTASRTGATSSVQMTARVLSSPPFSPYDTLLLDAGAHDGIALQDLVTYDNTVALGAVDTVNGNTSRVRLFSSPGTEQSVRVGTRDFLVVARGVGGGVVQMLVLKEEAVSRGESVFLPDGMLFARVDTIVQNESDAFALVYAVVPFNLFEVRDVVVVPR